MADTYKKISDFTKSTAFGDDDLLLVSQSGTTKALKGSALKAFATAAGIDAAKINNATVNGSGHLIIGTTDGTSIDVGKVTGDDGVSVTGASIDAQYHLILTFSDGTTKDAGYCRGASGSGTGDMLKETYDADGAVEEAGGISTFFDNKYLDKYYDDQLMSAYEYDGNNEVAYCGGIEWWARSVAYMEARDISEPVGTIRTTVRKRPNNFWTKCDGSMLYFSDSPILWQQMNGQLAFSQHSTTMMNYVSGLSNICWSDAVKFNGYWWLAVSGVSGSNAVLYIFRTASADYESRWALAKTYTVSTNTGTYPCALGFGTDSETNDGTLMVVWTVGDTKIYYTTLTDSDIWYEKTGHGMSALSGHEIQMTASGDLTGFLMCDKSTCELYLLNSVQGTFQTIVEDAEAFDGWTTTAISVSSDNYDTAFVARSMAKTGSSDTAITLYRAASYDLTDIEWEKLWGKSSYTYGNSQKATELSNVCCPLGWDKIFLAYTYNNSEFIRIAVLDYRGTVKNFDIWTPTAADSTWPLKRPRLSCDYSAGVILTYQCQKNSEESGAMFICCGKREPFTEVSISSIPVCGSPAWFGAYISDNGSLLSTNIYDAAFSLPDISLGSGTTTYIKTSYEENWPIDG